MKIGLVAPVKPSHPYLENDPAPLFDLHDRRLAPWLWFRASDNAKAGGTDNVFPPMQGWSGSGCDLSSGKLAQVDWASIGWVNSRLLLSHTFMLLLTTPGFGAGSDGWRLPPGWRSGAKRWAGFWTLFPRGLAPLWIWSVRRWTRVPGAGQRRTPAGPSMTWGLIDRLWHGGKYRYRTGPKGR